MNNFKEIDNLCLVAECSNGVFHHTRVMLTTFINRNKWFDGTVVLLTLKSQPLSDHNMNIMLQIYDDVVVYEIPDSDIDKLNTKVKKRYGYSNIFDYLSPYAFKIKSRGNIYLSRNIAVMKDISKILSDDKLSIASSSESFPSVGANVDGSMMFIPHKYLGETLFNSLMTRLNNSIIDGSHSYIKEFIDLNNIDTNILLSAAMANAAIFTNNKYAVFVRYSSSINSILIKDATLTDARNSRIQTYWNQLMHKSQMSLNAASKKTVRNIVARSSNSASKIKVKQTITDNINIIDVPNSKIGKVAHKGTYVFNQFFGIGDILFIEPIMLKYFKEGYDIVLPVLNQYLNIQPYFPYIKFVDKDLYDIDYENQTIVKDGDTTILPMRWSLQFFNSPLTETMRNKYKMVNMDLSKFRTMRWLRHRYKEHELMEHLNIKNGEKYNLINLNFHTFDKNKIDVSINNGYRNISMDFIEGFTLLDWAMVIENAHEIHSVNTSTLFLFETLDLKADSIHLYSRNVNGNDFKQTEYLRSKNYILHN